MLNETFSVIFKHCDWVVLDKIFEGCFLISFCSAQSFTVDIPNDLECKDCTIRLVRQALEWSNRYLFWSCADVDILQPRDYAEDCSGNTNVRLKGDEKIVFFYN